MKDLRISVRGLVEFLLRTGSLTHSGTLLNKNAMLEGARVHRKLQKSMPAGYRPEVPLKIIRDYDGFALTVEGRADGIFTRDGETWIDEIKGVYRDLSEIAGPVPVHLAQAMCYGRMYLAEHPEEERLHIQIRYCNLETDQVKILESVFTARVLEDWFEALCRAYEKWAAFKAEWEDIRDSSLVGLEFPYDYRPGQQQLVKDVYAAAVHRRQLFVQAPTGVGKTMSVIFPAVHALGKGLASGIFYLTAKTVAASVAREAFRILKEKGLKLKSLSLTAKGKLCVCEEPDCDARVCERADGHYDRVNDALYALLSSSDTFTREDILQTAEAYRVCPYELQTDLTDFCDALIGDYNYAFDPVVKLKRFLTDDTGKNLLFLIDEAHNLVDRAREMFSASLSLSALRTAGRALRGLNRSLSRHVNGCIRLLESLQEEQEGEASRRRTLPESLLIALMNLSASCEDVLAEQPEQEKRKVLLELYFSVRDFLYICDLLDDNYIVSTEKTGGGDFLFRLFCINPADNLADILSGAGSAVFFSATLLPVSYYRKLLSARTDDYAVYVESPFPKENRLILAAGDVSSLYRRRTPEEYAKFARYLSLMACGKKGRYMAFFPSYEMLSRAAEAFEEVRPFGLSVLVQQPEMTEKEREDFLEEFSREGWLLAFCVMGGIFSEGIDLTGDRLIGVAVAGTGLPGISPEREQLKTFYEERGLDGFDYAYRFPGMNRVLQAAGRVIRTMEDTGVILLLDDRFLTPACRQLFPREWTDVKACTLGTVKETMDAFWLGKKPEQADVRIKEKET